MGRPKKSKKRSATKRREVFFVDRALGRLTVPGQLRKAGLKVETHFGRYKDTTPDDVWLRDVGRRRWVVLKKDKNIRKRPIEVEAIIAATKSAHSFSRAVI